MADDLFATSLEEKLRELDRQAAGFEQQQLEAQAALEQVMREGSAFAQGVAAGNDGAFPSWIPERFLPDRNRRISDQYMDSAPGPRSTVEETSARRRSSSAKRKARVPHREMRRWCEEILREHGGPMHVSDIADALRNGAERGYQIPGQGTDSNVSVHLARADDMFEPTGSKGMWRLVGGN